MKPPTPVPEFVERLLRHPAEFLHDRLANEACGMCLYGIGSGCECPTRDDQIGWVRDFALAFLRAVLRGVVIHYSVEFDRAGADDAVDLIHWAESDEVGGWW